MREILFRGKSIKSGEWIFGNLLRTDYGIFVIQNYTPFEGLGKYEIEPKTVCQYIGLCDKDRNKIFENDIVGRYSEYRDEWNYGIVGYGEFNCSCCSGVYGWHFGDEDIRDCELYKVKGNVFDNPELLKGDEQ